ncbi:MAG: hypothetical protein A3J59_03105 [Candidatus Buchananbacteria bacterium RIFCSPHIGHO2_02_FULL_56_16]|uniref:PrgI family protein n=1 Tax=Candidatus Buchananbacteria bacterium RIFCSPHIGHO2_02_FULL_56_16 TaxID=1797542 RepID=A0A1G1YFK2_9BACT|nr:MAG: hypothetical protein A3J59_03105 [Candidatus Buchananbacteria bacterium RIFCSPHIGHO2_02_FULL_56_16]
MQQFVVPQFIDVEDKIIGPITVRQFLILLAGAGVSFVAYKLSDLTLFVFEFAVISLIFFTFAFIKINGKPIHYLFLNLIQTSRRARLRVWKKKVFHKAELHKLSKEKKAELPVVVIAKNKVKASRLAELSLIVDTGGIYQGEALPLAKGGKEQLL